MTTNVTDEDDYGPRYEVWLYLFDGLDLARLELDALDSKSRESVDKFADRIIAARKSYALGKDQEMRVELYDLLMEDEWYRFAAELELGKEGVSRAASALERFLELRPVLTSYKLGEKATAYLREVIDTYLFGFDAACVALCGATLEQVLRELVLAHGLYTEPRLRRESPSGNTLLQEAKRAGRIGGAYDAAKRLLDHRNHVMHRNLWEEKIAKGIALQCVNELGQVLVELGGD